MKYTALASAATAAALVLTGCSEPETDRPETASILDEYFEAIGSNDATQLADAERSTVAGSPAARYLAHVQDVAKANSVNDEEKDPASVEVLDEGDSVEVCDDSCSTYTDFSFENGKLTDFSADGAPVDDRLLAGDANVVKSHDVAGYEVVSAAESGGEDQSLVVVMRLHAYKRPIIPVHRAVYRSADGEQVDAADSTFPARIYPDSHQLAVVRFPHAAFGGEILIDFSTSDSGSPVMDTARIPVAQD